MRMSRRFALNGAIRDYEIRSTSVSLESKSWVTRNSSGTVTETVQDTAKEWSTTADLSRYKKVHFQVTGGEGSRSISAGSVTTSNPSNGERVLDVSGIANRSSLTIKVNAARAEATAAGYYPSTNVTKNNISVSRIWATAH